MARRNLLHKSLLEDFKTYLTQKGVKHRPGKGDYQVLQVYVCVRGGNSSREPQFAWSPIYEKLDAKEHYTIQEELVTTVRLFTAQRQKPETDPVLHNAGSFNSNRDHLSFAIKASSILEGDAHKQMQLFDEEGSSPLIPVFENGNLVNNSFVLLGHDKIAPAMSAFSKRDIHFDVIKVDSISNMPEQKP